MSAARKVSATSLSKAKSVEQIADFWDAHSLDDHWGDTRKASFTVRATRRRRITIDPDVYTQIEALARLRGISTETLVNLWVAEHLKRSRIAQ